MDFLELGDVDVGREPTLVCDQDEWIRNRVNQQNSEHKLRIKLFHFDRQRTNMFDDVAVIHTHSLIRSQMHICSIAAAFGVVPPPTHMRTCV